MNIKRGIYKSIFSLAITILLNACGASSAVPKTTTLIPAVDLTSTTIPVTITVTLTVTPTIIPTSTPTPVLLPIMDASCIPGNKPVQVAWSHGGDEVAVSSQKGLYIFSSTFSLLRFFQSDTGLDGLSFDSTGSSIYAGTTTGKVLQIQVNSGEVINIFDEEVKDEIVDTVILSEDGHRLLAATDGGKIRIWDVDTHKIWNELEATELYFSEYVDLNKYTIGGHIGVGHIAAARDFTWLSFVDDKGALRLWTSADGIAKILVDTPSKKPYWVNYWIATDSKDLIAYMPEPFSNYLTFVSIKDGHTFVQFRGTSPFAFSADGAKFAYENLEYADVPRKVMAADTNGQRLTSYFPDGPQYRPLPFRGGAWIKGAYYTGFDGPRLYLNSDGSKLISIWVDSLEVIDTTIRDYKRSLLLLKYDSDRNRLCIQTPKFSPGS